MFRLAQKNGIALAHTSVEELTVDELHCQVSGTDAVQPVVRAIDAQAAQHRDWRYAGTGGGGWMIGEC